MKLIIVDNLNYNGSPSNNIIKGKSMKYKLYPIMWRGIKSHWIEFHKALWRNVEQMRKGIKEKTESKEM